MTATKAQKTLESSAYIDDEVTALVNIVGVEARVKPERILGRSREWEVATARQCVYCVLYNRGWTVSQIGRAMNRDHSCIIYGIRALNDRYGQRGQRMTTSLMNRLNEAGHSPLIDEAIQGR